MCNKKFSDSLLKMPDGYAGVLERLGIASLITAAGFAIIHKHHLSKGNHQREHQILNNEWNRLEKQREELSRAAKAAAARPPPRPLPPPKKTLALPSSETAKKSPVIKKTIAKKPPLAPKKPALTQKPPEKPVPPPAQQKPAPPKQVRFNPMDNRQVGGWNLS